MMNKLAKFSLNYKSYFLISLITLVISVFCSIFVLPSHTIAEQARSTESFIDSIGVNVHLGYDNTPYMKYDDIIKPRLQELGIRHIRTNIHKAFNKKAIKRVKDLANIGIRSVIVTNPSILTSTESVKVIKSQIEGVEMIEGPNEWNINPRLQYKGKSFPEGVIKFQKELYSAIINDPDTAHLEVIAPSLAYSHLINPDVERLGSLPCDINNMHSYPGGRIPSVESLDTVQIPGNKRLCGQDKPIIATETGYNNAINLKKDDSGISENAAAKYLNRLFLEYFNRNVKRTYTYELIDMKLNPELDIKEQNWGLLKANGSKKRGFKALKNLIAILQDSQIATSTSSISESLDYSLQGDLTNIHHTLLQKKNGTFYLILWQEVYSYNREEKVEIKVPDNEIVMILNAKISRANIYRPLDSKKAFKIFNNPRKFRFRVPDHPVVLELIPYQLNHT